MVEKEKIILRGAREHNLKNIDVEFSRNQLVVITGLSGSGKSSLAFDTIYAEGQRRYVESLSAYARQFLGLMEKPDIDYIEGLSPAISIEQRSAGKNPRSTVGTVTEIYDYLRLLFARIGVPHCPNCGKRVERQTVQQIVDQVLSLPENSKIQILAPIIRGRKGEYREIFQEAQRDGFVRVRVDGQIYELDQTIALDKNKKHNIEIVVDRLVVQPKIQGRLTDSVETALNLASGIVLIDHLGQSEHLYSERYACIDCGISYEELEPRLFSFNSPYGACPECKGLGVTMKIDPDLVIPDRARALVDGAIVPWGKLEDGWYRTMVQGVAAQFGHTLQDKFADLSAECQKALLYGTDKELTFHYRSRTGSHEGLVHNKFEGIINHLQRRFHQTDSDNIREWIESFMNSVGCEVCGGARLKPQARFVKIHGTPIQQVTAFSIRQCLEFFTSLELNHRDAQVGKQIIKEICERLGFLVNVGLDYLTLDRNADTLAGGEAQRIRLATQIGSQLVGVLYILDEPSIGLHQRDNRRLIDTLKTLRDLGNTVIVVEHDKETMLEADYLLDLGPGAGEHGGRIVAQGTPQEVAANRQSITGDYLAGRRRIEAPIQRRNGNGQQLILRGACGNNLKNVDLCLPLGKLICITGVSGSGKSSLINETLYSILRRHFYHSKDTPLPFAAIEGVENIDKVIDIDQSPIGRTPRSNPATYTGLFSPIRDLFSQLPEARIRGYKPGRFSFNVKGGRCEACQGDGIIKIEMHFLPDVYVTCEACKGKRYNRETLEIKYRNKSISDILELTVEQAHDLFQNIPSIQRKLKTLQDVGLGYIRLGQQATTLSGGEAQRVKLATELSKWGTGKTLYILDEPTTGLHFEDIKMLLTVLNRLVDRGNTVVVIEHHLDVIKTADHVIDMGPDGGERGGQIVAQGSPEEIAQNSVSYTGKYLAEELAASRTNVSPASALRSS
ncbi:MAG TPA: excinuclease ABC subunit UvrA [bacterium]|nr:excinuclease ABC subunit UvrA [bacterium]HPG44394.1 excinuclease ABC subunit UvrA [bacterium]HPM96952.1 excinuclease ABC subunit UvrA [bacterium]